MDDRLQEVSSDHGGDSAEKDSEAYSRDMAIVITTGIFALLVTLSYCITAFSFLLDNGRFAVYSGFWAFLAFPVVAILQMFVMLPINLMSTKSTQAGVDAKIMMALKVIPLVAFLAALFAFLLVIFKSVVSL